MILDLAINDIITMSEQYFCKMCGFNSKTKHLNSKLEASEKVRIEYFNNSSMRVYINPFNKDHIINDEFIFEDNHIFCNVLNRIDHNSILGGYMYIFSAPKADFPEDNIIEMFYIDTWQTAFIDAGRDKLYEEISINAKKEYAQDIFLTDSFGPGFYGISSDTIPYFHQYVGGTDTGICLTEYGMMKPVKSIIGLFLVLNKQEHLPPRDCCSCLANHRGCEFCKNSTYSINSIK